MGYYREGETARLLEDWRRWSPEQSSSGSMWRERVDTSGYRIAPIPVMRGEAADTHAALGRMDQRERNALEEYHTCPRSVTVERQAKRLKVSASTYQRLLHSVHRSFWRERDAIVSTARSVGGENARRANITAMPGAVGTTPDRPASGSVTVFRRAAGQAPFSD